MPWASYASIDMATARHPQTQDHAAPTVKARREPLIFSLAPTRAFSLGLTPSAAVVLVAGITE
jgi:hypothetical protein